LANLSWETRAALKEPTMANIDIEAIKGYHAHVYYDADSKADAARLRAEVESSFDVEMGRWHDNPIGPHPMWSYQIAFDPELFGSLVPWLILNRADLIVFVHPLTDDIIEEHTTHAIWLGEKQALDIGMLERVVAKNEAKASGSGS
jgi:DOPA 4,5-dioxygenase